MGARCTTASSLPPFTGLVCRGKGILGQELGAYGTPSGSPEQRLEQRTLPRVPAWVIGPEPLEVEAFSAHGGHIPGLRQADQVDIDG